ncbi:MAG: SGNH/GDSL hydrolase family protein [Candidatus Dormibacteria bacterium]
MGVWRGALVAVIGSVLAFGGFQPASAAPTTPYLALGDSITFGYVSDPPAGDGSDPYADAANFVGYPMYAGAAAGLNAVDAACPGETSTSLITPWTPDAGCTAYRASHPLHVAYAGSQLNFAQWFLQTHPDTQLVTIAIGINDVGLFIAHCGGWEHTACIDDGLSAVLDTVRANVTVIVGALRRTGYDGTIMLVNYFTLEYANQQTAGVMRDLDSSIAAVAADEHLPVADTFNAFMNAAAATRGDACAAGLFGDGRSMLGACDEHPSAAGQRLMATAVEAALTR